jgi:hypothetical protein
MLNAAVVVVLAEMLLLFPPSHAQASIIREAAPNRQLIKTPAVFTDARTKIPCRLHPQFRGNFADVSFLERQATFSFFLSFLLPPAPKNPVTDY